MHNLENSETWNPLCIRKNVTYDNICIHAKTDKKKKNWKEKENEKRKKTTKKKMNHQK